MKIFLVSIALAMVREKSKIRLQNMEITGKKEA